MWLAAKQRPLFAFKCLINRQIVEVVFEVDNVGRKSLYSTTVRGCIIARFVHS
jgi:hypothetical protein